MPRSYVDAHVHLYPSEVNLAPASWAESRGEAHWKVLCTRQRRDGRPVQAFPSVDELLRAMDTADVERAILQGWYWENPESCVAQNRAFQEWVRAFPDRLSACLTLHPRVGITAIEAQLRRARDEGFCGVGELSPHSQLYPIDDPAFSRAMELAGELALPVVLHVTEPLGRGYPGRVLTPLPDFVRLARAHPATVFILAHWGARLPLDPELGAEVRSLRNVFFDTAASPLLYGMDVFREFCAAVGAERILFGSDFPLILFPREEDKPGIERFLRLATAAGLAPKDVAAIFSGNARRIFRLP